MELAINLIDVNHSGYNRETHQENLLRGLTFQVEINGQPFEYRAKEVSSTGKVQKTYFYPFFGTVLELCQAVRGVCSSEKKNAENKTCHAALLFIPRPVIPIAEIGTKKNQKTKFGLSPGIQPEILFNVENWERVVHNHRGKLFSMRIQFFTTFLADCAQTIDENGFCRVTRHFEQCKSSRTSKNSVNRPRQRQIRENVVHLAEENPVRQTRQIIKDGMLQIPEFRSPTGGLVAGAAETSGITQRRERQSVKNVKNILRGGDTSIIPERFKTIKGHFPSIINGRRQIQRDEKQFIREKEGKLYCFVASDLDFLENESVYCDGTFKMTNPRLRSALYFECKISKSRQIKSLLLSSSQCISQGQNRKNL